MGYILLNNENLDLIKKKIRDINLEFLPRADMYNASSLTIINNQTIPLTYYNQSDQTFMC